MLYENTCSKELLNILRILQKDDMFKDYVDIAYLIDKLTLPVMFDMYYKEYQKMIYRNIYVIYGILIIILIKTAQLIL